MSGRVVIEISNKLAEELLGDYEKKTSVVQQRIKSLTEKISMLEEQLANLRDEKSENEDELSTIQEAVKSMQEQLYPQIVYNIEWARWEKAEFALKKIGRFATITEIVDLLNKYEPGTTVQPFHPTLSQKIESGSIFMRMPPASGQGDYEYGLREWVDRKGRIPNKYYKSRQLKDDEEYRVVKMLQ